MEKVSQNPNCLSLAGDFNILLVLQNTNQALERVQNGLSSYLELKRLAFPRFFFLSNDEMLQILSQTKDPRGVAPHLRKCFEGIHGLQFEAEGNISGLVSAVGEVLPLKTHVWPALAAGGVEKWLIQLEAAMVESVLEACFQSSEDYSATGRSTWLLKWQSQVALTVACVHWTSDVNTALRSKRSGGS
eukprot:jgi/Botrbrau1/8167/Bobra.357_2s0013.1